MTEANSQTESPITLVYYIAINRNIAVIIKPGLVEKWCGTSIETWQQVSQGFTSVNARLLVLSLPKNMSANVVVYSRNHVHVDLNITGSVIGLVNMTVTYGRDDTGLVVSSVEGNVTWLCRVNSTLSYDIYYAGGFLPLVSYENYTSFNPVSLFLSSAGMLGSPSVFLINNGNTFLSNSMSNRLKYYIVVLGEPPGRGYTCCDVSFEPGETVLPIDDKPNGTRTAREVASSAASDLGVDYGSRKLAFGGISAMEYFIEYNITKKGKVELIFSNRSVVGKFYVTKKYLYHAAKGFLIEMGADDLMALPVVDSLLGDAFLLAYGEPYKVGGGILTSYNTTSDLPRSIARLAQVSGFGGVNLTIKLARINLPQPPRVTAGGHSSARLVALIGGSIVAAILILLVIGRSWLPRPRRRE